VKALPALLSDENKSERNKFRPSAPRGVVGARPLKKGFPWLKYKPQIRKRGFGGEEKAKPGEPEATRIVASGSPSFGLSPPK